MNFGLNESQTTLQSSARRFLAAECPIAEVRRLMETDTAHDQALWSKIAAQGWMGLLIPEDLGGSAMGPVEMAVLLEEMGRALLPGPYFSTVLLAASAIDYGGGEDRKREYLTKIASGGLLATLALLEESASWNPDAVRMRASTSSNGAFRLHGRKLFVPDAAVAGLLVCAARLDSDFALFLVDANTQGLAIRPLPAMDNTRKLYEVAFDAVELPPTALLVRGPRAYAALQRTLDLAAAGLAAEMTGGMQRVLEITVEYAKTRKQFGKSIGSFQAVQHLCADMLLYTEGSRSASYYAAWALGSEDPGAPTAVSVAKAYSSDAFREVANRGIQVHGGMGFTWENDMHLYYRRAKASEIAYGDAIFHRERIARFVMDRATPETLTTL